MSTKSTGNKTRKKKEDTETPTEEKVLVDTVKDRIPKRPLKQRLLDRFYPDKTFLINMELSNGMHRSVIIKQKDGTFVFKGGRYVVDTQLKYYSIDDKIWCLDYHEEFSLPIKREIKITQVKKAMVATGTGAELITSTNPATLQQFITREVAKQVMTGQDLDEKLKMIKLVAILGLVASAINLVILIKSTGILNGLNLPI